MVWKGMKCVFSLRVNCTLRVLENSILRRMFGPNGEAVTIIWIEFNNVELHYPYSPQNSIRNIN
jgi:hypothetical protein